MVNGPSKNCLRPVLDSLSLSQHNLSLLQLCLRRTLLLTRGDLILQLRCRFGNLLLQWRENGLGLLYSRLLKDGQPCAFYHIEPEPH